MFDAGQMRVGRRLAIKVLNASKFVWPRRNRGGRSPRAVDRAMLIKLGDLVRECDTGARQYEYGRAIEIVEREFWGFCDDYLELVKGRRYGDQGPEAAGSATAR